MIDDILAKLLRGLGHDLGTPIMGELTSDIARERARTAIAMLTRLVEKADVAAEIGTDIVPRMRSALRAGCDALNHMPRQPELNEEIASLRRAGAELIAAAPAEALDALRDIARADAEWCAALGRAAATSAEKRTTSAPAEVLVTPDTLTRYLRARFPGAPSIEVRDIATVSGGRSKATLLVSLAPNPVFPETVVMRQDTGADHIATYVVDERNVLDSLADLDLPLPTPLYCEPERTELGGPFLLMKRLPGRTKGSYFGFEDAVGRSVAEDMAIMFARLHSVDVAKLPFLASPTPGMLGDQMAAVIAERRAAWRAGSSYVSPIMEYAYVWLEAECRRGLGAPALIHGDIRGHNLLVEDDRISGILDWEFAHIGDPAEDLAYARPAVEHLMPWDEFMDLYRAAGGAEIDDRRLRIFTVWGMARNASFGAGSIRTYADGVIADFRQGAVSYAALSFFEKQIAEILLPVLAA